jgi:hypothetical protein
MGVGGGVNSFVKKNSDLETDWLIIVLLLIIALGYLALSRK